MVDLVMVKEKFNCRLLYILQQPYSYSFTVFLSCHFILSFKFFFNFIFYTLKMGYVIMFFSYIEVLRNKKRKVKIKEQCYS